MFKKKTLILTMLCFCISAVQFSLFAQKSTARISVEPYEIAIGQQATINLQVIAPKGRQLVLPVYADSLIQGIEVLGMPKADTTFNHEVMTINQKYIVTSFDSALYHIPYIQVIDGKDTIKSNELGLKVISPNLSEATLEYLEQLKANPQDSLIVDKLGISDIKDVLKPPFVWQDYLIFIIGGILLLLALVAIGLTIYLFLQKKNKGYYFKPVVVKPPHVIALGALNHVKGEKLWQQGREKEYFTEITDILRKYIEDRFHVNAFEKTSEEILDIARNFMLEDSSLNGLKQVLTLADLVKFAKYKPFPDENDLSLVNAYLFVNQTKIEEPIIEENNENQNTPSNQPDEEEEEEVIDWTVTQDQIAEEHRDINKKKR